MTVLNFARITSDEADDTCQKSGEKCARQTREKDEGAWPRFGSSESEPSRRDARNGA
jgi:hypothetical protein